MLKRMNTNNNIFNFFIVYINSFCFFFQVTTMKTSPYLVIIFLKILVLTLCAGQFLQSQQIKRRNSLFNTRNRYSRHRNLQAQQQQQFRLNSFKRNKFSSSASSRNKVVRRRPKTTKNDLNTLRKEVFFVKLEDGFFGCQVNASVDVLQLFEISKLCDGTSQCWQGSDESNAKLKCTSK